MLVHLIYPLLRMLSDIYFVLLQLAFDSYNGKILFWSKKTVRWPSRDHQLLCLSARMAAKKIRLGEVLSLFLKKEQSHQFLDKFGRTYASLHQ